MLLFLRSRSIQEDHQMLLTLKPTWHLVNALNSRETLEPCVQTDLKQRNNAMLQSRQAGCEYCTLNTRLFKSRLSLVLF